MKMRMKRITGFFLSLVMVMGFLPLNPIVSYANDNASGDVKIDDKNFPDPTFRDYVSQNFDKSHHDVKLSQNELDDVKKIAINNTSVTSLQGIEYFKNLDFLDCSRNKITSLKLGNNTNLCMLDCSINNLTSLDVSKNINLDFLDCSRNKITSLDVSKNINLRMLNCSGNQLTSLDLSGNTMPISLSCNNQQYNITVIKGIRKFKYSDFPGRFDKDKVKSLVGATLGDDALIVNDDNPSVVTYKYKVGDRNNQEMSVKLNVTYFDPDLVRDIKVKKQPTKRVYTDGENLDLTGLKVTLTDNQGLTKDVEFTDFGTYKITADPENKTLLTVANNNKPVTLTKTGSQATAKTKTLTVNPKVFDKEHVDKMVVIQQPTKLIYTDGETLDLTGLKVTLTDNQGLTKDVEFTDFGTYKITADPENKTLLTVANNNKPVTLTKTGSQATAKTKTLTVNPKVFDKEHVDKMVVIQQPTKLIYTDGETLDLTGLKVTLTDNQGLTKDVEFTDFGTYSITATPDNGTVLKLGHNGNPVKLTRGNLTATTSALKVKAKESIPTHVGGGSTSTSGSGSAGGSAGGFSAGMNYYAPTTVDKDELNIQIDSAESDYKPGYAGDGSGAAVKQAADRLGDALAQAKRVAANPNATQAQVGASARKLADARKAQHEKPDPKPHHEKPDSKSHHEKQAPKSQTKKRIGMIHKTDKSASFAGLIAVLVGSIAVIGFSIAGFAILRRRK